MKWRRAHAGLGKIKIAAVFLKVGGISLAGFGAPFLAFEHSLSNDLKRITIESSTQHIRIFVDIGIVLAEGSNVLVKQFGFMGAERLS
jgi:hypothetical protein